jgi:hypothetical protein
VNRVDGLRCIDCAGYGDLVFLGAGDNLLTRRATARSSRKVVVVKWSSARKRHERQGLLLEKTAVEQALASVMAEPRKLSREHELALKILRAELDGTW